MSEESGPQVAFLGFAERAGQVRDGETNLLKWNVIGLKYILLTNFFPFLLDGWNLGFAIRRSAVTKELTVKLRADSGEEIASIKIETTTVMRPEMHTRSDGIVAQQVPQGWAFFFLPVSPSVGMPSIFIQKQGRYFLALQLDDNTEEIIGEFHCVLVEPAPLTPERVAAIKSNPKAIKAVRVIFGCIGCRAKCQVYAALERMPSQDAEGFTWYQDIPEHFACACGKTQLDLSTLKRNFFALVGQPTNNFWKYQLCAALRKERP